MPETMTAGKFAIITQVKTNVGFLNLVHRGTGEATFNKRSFTG
jgi:hypothetical protein